MNTAFDQQLRLPHHHVREQQPPPRSPPQRCLAVGCSSISRRGVASSPKPPKAPTSLGQQSREPPGTTRLLPRSLPTLVDQMVYMLAYHLTTKQLNWQQAQAGIIVLVNQLPGHQICTFAYDAQVIRRN